MTPEASSESGPAPSSEPGPDSHPGGNLGPSQQTRAGASFSVVLFATLISFASFYAPQPLMPMLGDAFSVNATTIAWIMGVSFIGLSIAPMTVGLLLRSWSIQTTLWLAVGILGLSQFALALSNDFTWLIAIRVLQSLMFPLIFTGAITYCSRAGTTASRLRRVSIYISATIVGGFVGRIAAGFIGASYGWQAPFLVLGVVLLLASATIYFRVSDNRLQATNSSNTRLLDVIKRPDIRSGLLVIFTSFFTFSATLNALPFRIVALDESAQASAISLVYTGYVIGVFVALSIPRIVLIVGGEIRTTLFGIIILTIGLAGLMVPTLGLLIAVGFLFSGGMFIVHTTLSGFLNSLAGDDVSLVNGVYISTYYAAAAAGSIIPLWFYNQFGWTAFVMMLVVIAILSLWPLRVLNNVIVANK